MPDRPGHPGQRPTRCARRSPAPASTPPPHPIVTTSGTETILVQTEPLTTDESAAGRRRHRRGDRRRPERRHLPDRHRRRAGASRSRKRALIGLVVFLVLVVLFIWAYFREWKMSVAAIVALVHDLVITVGVYALSGFEVTPATVTGLLTILGFSLYDTVVVFDKVRENTKNLRADPHDLRRGGQPRGQPDAGPLDQHLDRGAAPGRRDPVRRRRAAGLRRAQGPRARAVRRHGRRRLLLDLHRHPAAGAPEVERDRGHSRPTRRAKARQRHEADRYASVPAFTEDMPIGDEPGDGRPAATTRPAPASRRRRGRTGARPAAGRGRVAPPPRRPGPAEPRRPDARSRRGSRGRKRGKK